MIEPGTVANQTASGEIDLTQFYQVFFEEAGENLSSMETLLLAISVDEPAEDDLHAIFRAAHSIKGGAATFGFQDVTELTHELETLLDRVRKRELALSTEMIDVLLEAGDVLKAQLAAHQHGGEAAGDISTLLSHVRRLAGEDSVHGGAPAVPHASTRTLEMTIGPLGDLGIFDNVIELFGEIPDLGKITFLDDVSATCGTTSRRYRVETACPDEELCDLLGFHVSREQVRLVSPPAVAHVADEAVSGLPPLAGRDNGDPGYGLFDELPTKVVAAPSARTEPKVRVDRPAAGADAATLRVSVEKVDQLINLVGELVITQSMLSNKGRDIDSAKHAGMVGGLADLERNTRSLQEAVMSIRMIPMAVVFNRFPRMLRDLAAKLGKEIDLQTSGEATELDKGLIEKITDPLTHLIRNSVDHGIELPAARIAAGKPARGTLSLSAFHRGGSIIIEVRDDGAGLNRNRILAKARERGMAVSDAMADKDVWQLIWAPGFSTAEQVTDVSGRGVGMDVVTKNIAALGGSVELDSAEGLGTRVSVRLPLTLAIMDGMSVAVNGDTFILPLANVVESLQVSPDMLRTVVGEGRVAAIRDEYLPVVCLHEVLKSPTPKGASSSKILVIVEADGARTALMVDQLIGQHQVVVKNLEANYRKVPGVSGATILGDGRVALILDVAQVVAACSSGPRTTRPTHQPVH